MSSSLYDASVPTILRALQQHQAVLQAGEAWAKETGLDRDELLQLRLAPDMLPLVFQTQTVCNVAKGALTRIGGVPPFKVEDDEKTLADLYRRLDATIALFKEAKREKFASPSGTCTVQLGPEEMTSNNSVYIANFVLPNLFFHHTTAYNILRLKGVPLGKALFLGKETLFDSSV